MREEGGYSLPKTLAAVLTAALVGEMHHSDAHSR